MAAAAMMAAAMIAAPTITVPALAADAILLSTQFGRAAEASILRDDVLGGFEGTARFQPIPDYRTLERVLRSADKAGGTVVGAYHGQLVSLWRDGLLDGSPRLGPWFEEAGFDRAAADLSRLGERGGYVPWVSASYLMVARREALRYLPAGAVLPTLTYDQLLEWSARMAEATGRPQLGLPFGEGGLAHRLIEGYLLPSFTGGAVSRFRSAEAAAMWRYLRALWRHVDPRSLSYDNMSVPLESGEVMVAWDHTARLFPLFAREEDEFVAFPAPIGPQGRGHLLVVAGLAPGSGLEGAKAEAAEALIRYLTRPDVQRITVARTGFLPVLAQPLGDLPGAVERLIVALKQQSAEGSVLSLLPAGLGADSELFDTLFVAAFADIVLNGHDIGVTLERYAERINHLLERNATPCWPPDPPVEGACRVE